ncbi:MAG: hypothetical protein AB7T27_10270 [Kiritimatiellia bacterium]
MKTASVMEKRRPAVKRGLVLQNSAGGPKTLKKAQKRPKNARKTSKNGQKCSKTAKNRSKTRFFAFGASGNICWPFWKKNISSVTVVQRFKQKGLKNHGI